MPVYLKLPTNDQDPLFESTALKYISGEHICRNPGVCQLPQYIDYRYTMVCLAVRDKAASSMGGHRPTVHGL